MKKHFLLFLIVQFGLMLNAFAQVSVTSSGGTATASYTTLKGAFDAINAGTHTGAIAISITGSTTETASAVLNAGTTSPASYTSVSISPSGGAWTISGNLALPLIDLNGADNVKIDGLNTAGNALTISNTSTSSTANTSTIRFINDATADTITNCSILGSTSASVTTVVANIIFSTTTGTVGNDNNAITYCNLGPAGTSLPSKIIHSVGTTTTTTSYNSGITIANNNIYDFFYAAGANGAIFLGNANADWTISSNRFYQTASRSQTTAGIHTSVYVSGTTGNTNHSILNNIIGYSSSAGTGTYTITGVAATQFIGIYVGSASSSGSTSIQGNLVTNIALTGPFTGTTSTSTFMGVSVSTTTANVGNITPNTIGSMTTTGAITVSSSATSSCEALGIYLSSSNNCSLMNNNIGGITASNSSTGGANITGIRVPSGSSTHTISGNMIGGTVANSLQSLSTANGTQVYGIYIGGVGAITTGNTIRNLTAAGGTGLTSGVSVGGIVLTVTTTNQTVSQNTIYALSNTNTTAACTVTGIYVAGTTGTHSISRNFIHSLGNLSTAGIIHGIYSNGGVVTHANNMIHLGFDAAGTSLTNSVGIYGIYEASGTNNYYHNSVYVGGTNVATNLTNTYAFLSVVASGTRNYINNIFMNARSNVSGTAKHYAVRVGGTIANQAGLSMSNNVFFVNGTGGMLGYFNGGDVSTLSLWQVAVGGNNNTAFADPQFVAAGVGAATVDLHIAASTSPVEGMAIAVGAVTTDFDGSTRNTTTPDIGADEGAFGFKDAYAPVISYIKLINDASMTTRVENAFATMSDTSGINVTTGTRPRIYFKKTGDNNTYTGNTSADNGWKYVEASNTTSPFNFTINYALINGGSVSIGDTIQYFVVAQDLASVPNVQINSGAFSITPSDVALTAAQFPVLGTLNSYMIVGPRLSGIINVGAGKTYNTLTAAANDLTLRGISGPVTLNLTDALYTTPAETFPVTFGVINGTSGVNTVKVVSVTTTTISGSSATGIIDMNGASFVTIDGRVGGTGSNKDLVIENTSTAATSTIRFVNDAYKNKIQYCVLKGVATGASSGTVLFAGTNGTNGNDTNTIDNCDIKNGISRPLQGVYASGTTTTVATYNDNNIISNNNIYNFFNATTASSGIKVDAGNAGWQIINNSIFDTATITYTTAATHRAIFINAVSSSTTNGSGFSVTGNYIGGSAPAAGGAAPYTWVSTGTSTATMYTGIELYVGMGTPTLVQNNLITNFNMTTSSSGAAFMGINVERGVVNINGNTVGSTSNPTSMSFTATTAGGSFYGIRMGTTANGMGVTNITNNTICGIEVKGSTTAIIANFSGIASSGGTTTNITGNTIGSATMANAINASTAFSLTTANHVVRAIIANGSATTYNINGNLIANMNSNTVTGGTTNNHTVVGIIYVPGSANANPVSISNNIIRDLTNASQTIASSPNAAITGISIGTTANVTGVLTVNNNQIYALKLTGTATLTSVGIRGIYVAGGATGSTVANNRVHGFSVSAANTAAGVMAIETGGGIVSYYNNFISLGVDATGADENTGYLITAINDALGSNNFYYNSVYIGGQAVANGASATYAFYSSVTTNTRSFINNSFYNARSNSGGTGKHYAVRLAGTTVSPAGLTMNNNLMYTSGVGGVFGFYNNADVLDLTAWTTAVGLNASSMMLNPAYVLPNGSSATVNLAPGVGSPLMNAGTPVTGITTDIIGKPRSITTPTIGVGETNATLPVELLDFIAAKQQSGVELTWITASEMNNDHFDVQRSTDGQTFVTITQVKGHGTSAQLSVYKYMDAKIPSGVSTLYYRLVQVDVNGKYHTSDVAVVTTNKPDISNAMSFSPNPFNGTAEIRVEMEKTSNGTLRVTDLQGKTVLEKMIGLEAGTNRILFDALNDAAYNGMYFIYLVTPEETFVQRVIKGN